MGSEGRVCAGQGAGTVLTVDVVAQDPDALLVQSHHLREVGGFGARVHLHLGIQPSARKARLALLHWRGHCWKEQGSG